MILLESLRDTVLEAPLLDLVFKIFSIIKDNLMSSIILKAVKTDSSGERMAGKTDGRLL